MSCVILITVRLNSVRLPEKALLPIEGRPLLSHLVERLRRCERAADIILCTSSLSQDDPLQHFAEVEKIGCFRGHPDDVLLRITQAAQQHGAETVISCTGDNPLIDPVHADLLVDFHHREGLDFSRIDGLPWGTFSYVLSRAAMQRACEIKATCYTEMWVGYFTESGEFSCGTLQVMDPEIRWPELRLTVDVPEDFQLMGRIFGALYQPGTVFSLRDVVALCRRRPDLSDINAHVQQKPVSPIRLRSH